MRSKGSRLERYIAKELGGRRVYLSGSSKSLGEAFTGDVKALGLTFECKWRKDGFKTLYGWLEEEYIDALVVKADRKEPLIVVPLSTFKEVSR